MRRHRGAAAVCTIAAAVAFTACSTPQHAWTMPALAGTNLQDAQSRVHDLTGGDVDTAAHDATPAARDIAVDSDWRVCTQSVAAGQPVSTGQTIDLGVVKNNEQC